MTSRPRCCRPTRQTAHRPSRRPTRQRCQRQLTPRTTQSRQPTSQPRCHLETHRHPEEVTTDVACPEISPSFSPTELGVPHAETRPGASLRPSYSLQRTHTLTTPLDRPTTTTPPNEIDKSTLLPRPTHVAALPPPSSGAPQSWHHQLGTDSPSTSPTIAPIDVATTSASCI